MKNNSDTIEVMSRTGVLNTFLTQACLFKLLCFGGFSF